MSALLAMATAGVVLGVGLPASAATSPTAPEPGPPPIPSMPATVSGLPSSQWQTNSAVWALALSSNRLYAGGEFTSVRPPGAAAGTGEVVANRIAAFDSATGAHDSSFRHNVSGKVLALAVSPDQRTLYVGGEFTKVDNQVRNKVAAFDLTRTGAPLLPWAPSVNGAVRAITVSADSSSVVFGGSFTTVAGSARANIARVAAGTGALSSWYPAINGPVYALLLAPGGTRVIAGGNFETSNGSQQRALTSLEMSTGANAPMDDVIASCGAGCRTRSDVKALTTDGNLVYVGAEGTGGGWFDGTLAVDPVTGRQVWKNNCLGATQSVAVVGGALYDGSHAHDCTAAGGFGQAPFQSGPSSWRHLMALRTDNGGILDWFPNTNPGPTAAQTANELGPRAMVSDGTNLYVAGQFTTVNGAVQQGLTRFMGSAPRSAPAAVSGLSANLLPGGKAVVAFNTSSDIDSGVLTYRVYRDGKYTAPVATLGPVWSRWWKPTLLTFRESGLAAGSHFYQVDVVDETGQTKRSGRVTATSTTLDGYGPTVQASGPSQYWRLGETSGTFAADASGRGNTGTYSGALNQNVAGAQGTDRAIHLGPTGNVFSNARASTVPATFSAETWIRTSTTTGGRIFGFGNAQAGTSSSYDRALYMNNAGQLIFGVHPGSVQYVWSPKSYNDGGWHHVLVTQGSTGLRLYVDGNLVSAKADVTAAQNYSGYWRLGVDNLAGWPQRPSSSGFNGDVDEFAVYPTALTPADAKAHLTAE